MKVLNKENHIDMIKRKESETHEVFGDFVSFLR